MPRTQSLSHAYEHDMFSAINESRQSAGLLRMLAANLAHRIGSIRSFDRADQSISEQDDNWFLPRRSFFNDPRVICSDRSFDRSMRRCVFLAHLRDVTRDGFLLSFCGFRRLVSRPSSAAMSVDHQPWPRVVVDHELSRIERFGIP